MPGPVNVNDTLSPATFGLMSIVASMTRKDGIGSAHAVETSDTNTVASASRTYLIVPPPVPRCGPFKSDVRTERHLSRPRKRPERWPAQSRRFAIFGKKPSRSEKRSASTWSEKPTGVGESKRGDLVSAHCCRTAIIFRRVHGDIDP